MPTLKPFRDYDEHDVLNLFAYSGSNTVNKGTIVKIQSGWHSNADLAYDAMNGFATANTVNLRWNVRPKVTACTLGDTKPIGMMLFDVREEDENGEKLIYKPRKAAEMQATVSGQATPIVTRGIFLYSGVSGTIAAGDALYPGYAGELTNTVSGTRVATALGPKDNNNCVLIKLDI